MYALVLFICGLSVMVLELAGVRIISPFFGSSHVVYTSIIGVIMASLSIGYYCGGKLSKNNPTCYKLSVLIFITGIYILLLSFIQFDILRILEKNSISLIFMSLLASVIIFTVPSILLGMVSPYMIQIALNHNNKAENEGSIVGRLYAVSTVGSIIGTFLCGFFLIYVFGIETIFFGLSFLLFIAAVLCIVIDINKKK